MLQYGCIHSQHRCIVQWWARWVRLHGSRGLRWQRSLFAWILAELLLLLLLLRDRSCTCGNPCVSSGDSSSTCTCTRGGTSGGGPQSRLRSAPGLPGFEARWKLLPCH